MHKGRPVGVDVGSICDVAPHVVARRLEYIETVVEPDQRSLVNKGVAATKTMAFRQRPSLIVTLPMAPLAVERRAPGPATRRQLPATPAASSNRFRHSAVIL